MQRYEMLERLALGENSLMHHIPNDQLLELPDEILRHIFQYLSMPDLIAAGKVCHRFHQLATDDLIWRNKLWENHIYNALSQLNGVPKSIDVVFHDIEFPTNMMLYQFLHSKSLRKSSKDESSSLWKILWQRFYSVVLVHWQPPPMHSTTHFGMLEDLIPSFVLLGPGLEAPGTKEIVYCLVMQHSVDLCNGRLPQYTGIGRGLGYGLMVKVGERSVNILTLYSNSQGVREIQHSESQRLVQSRLFEPVDREEGFAMRESMRDVCLAADAILYAVDSQSQQLGRQELKIILDALPDTKPLAVLSLTRSDPESQSKHKKILDVPQELGLYERKNPWSVSHTCVADPLPGMIHPIEWIVQRRSILRDTGQLQ